MYEFIIKIKKLFTNRKNAALGGDNFGKWGQKFWK